ncbi:related to ENT3 - cytoskeletal adaptor [Melanopsichium pennsylvanicum]|uniref:Related to ENT3 - cytoskeletal adaptor n=2 Tax=Melanopsichium pennsylvanicum TaxID=63383 RepID=A0AAJ5C8S8_9BASI|nr:related to ENT3-cytoskeletal adaptor [Melanopsichium pennsylvanicum 4]SNX87884.1 related to ENT3 - cytoskeletal adaptor [Melanopsichium pennsylvanicum]
MDFDDIGSKLANLTMYDVKSLYRSARNYALNVSEIEAKVDEATNDDPWGASSTLMQEIALATNNFQDFNEIMPTIYRRFMEKEAREWRQIYKALQLLEYLVKHGSERVVDDARSHLATIKILRNFHYIDEKGKDQGINVRNRAKELADLLSDVDRIRQERRKARSNKSKYTGGGNGEFVPGSGTRYGGFGSDSYWAGGGAAPGAGSSSSFGGGGGAAARESFEEYDAGEYEETPAARPSSSTTRAGGSRSSQAAPPKKEAPKVADLFSFDDDDEPAAPAPSAVAAQPASGPAATVNDAFGDDFDDFQAAPASSAAAKPAAAPAAKSQSASFDFFDSAPAIPSAPKSTASSGVMSPSQPSQASTPSAGTGAGTGAAGSRPAASTNSSFNFDDLWAASSGKSSNAAGKQKMSMAEMAKTKSSNALFASSSSSSAQPAAQQNKKEDIFDLL